MTGSCSEEEEQFFDTLEDISSASDLGSDDGPENTEFDSNVSDFLLGTCRYDEWNKNPASICERRNKFLKLMRLSSEKPARKDTEVSCYESKTKTNKTIENSGAVLGSSDFKDESLSSQSLTSFWSTDAPQPLDGTSEKNLVCRVKSLDDGTDFTVDEPGLDGVLNGPSEVCSNQSVTNEEFERNLSFSQLVQRVMRRSMVDVCNLPAGSKFGTRGWFRKLGIVDSQVETGGLIINKPCTMAGVQTRMVKVRSSKKRFKEFPALYMGQDIVAHRGPILTMKFSPGGHYLASAGEDGIVRVWQVLESERSDIFDNLDIDAASVYFTLNHHSEIVPLHFDKQKRSKLISLRKSSDSTCVIFPRTVFQILEKPLYEFHGHDGEVLDLSWSKNKHILSSSADKTVRLWQVGCNQCLKVFYHNDFVTSVQFNPMDDNHFLSGSIDGKVRIWAIPDCQVVDWTDIKEIVTAVSYFPDGKGAIVGSMSGKCRFYNASDHLQLYAQICLGSKKKSAFKRITGFQFLPSDASKLLVTSGDSQVCILHGVEVVCKYRGPRSAATQAPAVFTPDGSQIVLATEDSNIYMWNYSSEDDNVSGQGKNNWSFECFSSNNASMAIPWFGMMDGNSIFSSMPGKLHFPKLFMDMLRHTEENGSQQCHVTGSSCKTVPISSPDHVYLSLSSKEMLPRSNSSVMPSPKSKTPYKFLCSCCHGIFCSPHAWCLVIVTAGWDGRIRSFQNYGLPARS